MIQPRTGEGHGAKQRAEGARVVLFDPERFPTVITLGMGGDKGRLIGVVVVVVAAAVL